MSAIMLIVTICVPLVTAVLSFLIPFKSNKAHHWFVEIGVIITSILAWMLILNKPSGMFILAHFTANLSFAFKLDGLGMVFTGIIATLWPLATLYSFEYMTKEEHERCFFMFYTLTYFVTLGIAMSANLITMYAFYELLTLATIPLVLHTLTKDAVAATIKYMIYSIGGAAFGFIGMIFVIIYGNGTTDFTLGGVLDVAAIADKVNVLLLVYVMAFFGFGVKAAVCPFSSWLPQAGVAPTPVTALLHAVAVVKAGAFAILRFTYYSYGTEFLRGTWAQTLVLLVTMFTIVYGCSRAVKETHIKRRLAYSTVSNLSYILFGAALMSPAGMIGALAHMMFHAVMKICSFFCAGAIMHQTEKHYVHELDGMGRQLPWVFGIFTVSAFALMGVPGLAGFISKFELAKAAFESGNVVAYFGVGCLLISALLTAIYMLTIVIRAFFPAKDFDYSKIAEYKDPNWKMLVPLGAFAVGIIVFGVYSGPLITFITNVAAGLY